MSEEHADRHVEAALRALLGDAGLLVPDLAADERQRRVRHANARSGGCDGILRGRTFDEALQTWRVPIPERATRGQRVEFLRAVAAGERAWIAFSAGRATRLRMPPLFDRLGIAGLGRDILATLPRADDEPPSEDEYRARVERGAGGVPGGPGGLGLGPCAMLQLAHDLGRLCDEVGVEANVDRGAALAGVRYVLVVNGVNAAALRHQVRAIDFAGFDPPHVLFIQQPDEGLLVLGEDGRFAYAGGERFPAGHAVPVVQIATDVGRAGHFTAAGEPVPLPCTVGAQLARSGVRRRLFFQANDLLALADMAMVERWVAAERAIADLGVGMVIEMRRNLLEPAPGGGLRPQKGGADLCDPDDPRKSHLRDTIALENELRPRQLSRMLYVFTEAVDELGAESLIWYATPRVTRGGSTAYGREAYSGDLSSRIRGGAASMAQAGASELMTFKVRARKAIAVRALDRQLAQPGFADRVDALLESAAVRGEGAPPPAGARGPERRQRDACALGLDLDRVDAVTDAEGATRFGVAVVAGRPLSAGGDDPGAGAALSQLARLLGDATGGAVDCEPAFFHLALAPLVAPQVMPVSAADLDEEDVARLLARAAGARPFDGALDALVLRRDGALVLLGLAPTEALRALAGSGRAAMTEARGPAREHARIEVEIARLGSGALAALGRDGVARLRRFIDDHAALSPALPVHVDALRVVAHFQPRLDRVAIPDIVLPLGGPAPIDAHGLHRLLVAAFRE